MSKLLEDLTAALQNEISNGRVTAHIDPEVLSEFMQDFATPPQSVAPAPAAPAHKAEPRIAPEPETVPKVAAAKSTTFTEPTAPLPPKIDAFENIPPATAPAKTALPLESMSLEELRQSGNTCSACDFDRGEIRSETTAVNEQAELMIITEPAGRTEEYMADPFHGEAGTMLIKMIKAMNFDPDETYLCMAHRCFGPGAREKLPETKPYLEKQIELVNPKVILIFGGAALNILLGEQSLMNCRGRWLEIGDIPAVATFPPAYLIHKPQSKKEAWIDMQQVLSRLKHE